ncbi:MAG: hypothetical protein ACI9Y1_002022 [Lentisphaeria bacterium]|jgi:hypothetical protein
MKLNNRTPFSLQAVILPNPQGIDSLCVLTSATFKIGTKWVLDEEQSPPQQEDEYWGEPENSSLKYASEYHTGKRATDVVVLGSAYAPTGQSVPSIDVGVAVGTSQKILRVFGDRQWVNGLMSKPEPFESMPIIYENAFGGRYVVDGEIKSQELRNPVGKGCKGKKSNSDMHGSLLPNIEDPQQLISSMHDTPTPAGFGFIAPHWMPRTQYTGTYDDAWQKTRAPYLPIDFSDEFNSCAPAGLCSQGYLQGGEEVKIVNMHPEGSIGFHLPEIRLKANVRIVRQRDQVLPFNLETVVIEPEQMILKMSWKSILPVNNNASKVQEINLSLLR